MSELSDSADFVDMSILDVDGSIWVTLDGSTTILNYEDAEFLRGALEGILKESNE